MNFLSNVINGIRNLLWKVRRFLVIILLLAMPIAIYLGFIREVPLFEAEYDIQLGEQTVQSIAQSPEEYPILPKSEYPEAYNYLQNLVNDIVDSPHIKHKDIFKYDDVKIIQNDSVLNAFCVPGGYIYVYSGIIKYLEHEDHLAGVIGHEIAHAELRHSSMKLQKEYGKSAVVDFIILANPATTLGGIVAADIFRDLVNLKYGREQEAQADEWSVKYLSDSKYSCDGVAGFFAQMIEEGNDVNIPEFLSDHPGSQNRVDDVAKMVKELGCSTTLSDVSSWKAFQEMFPK